MADPLSGTAIDYARIEAMVDKFVEVIAPERPVDPIALRAEYQVAVDIIKLLSDIRFRCLAFVTVLVTVATALLPETVDPGTRPALGLLGLLATLGITIYELRNSQLYEAAMHRAKTLERRLEMKGSWLEVEDQGLFAERPPYCNKSNWSKWANLSPDERKQSPPTLMRFWFIPVKHDHGLALIYGAALGAWVYLFVCGVLALPVPANLWSPVSVGYLRLIALSLGVVAGAVSISRFFSHDKNRVKGQVQAETSNKPANPVAPADQKAPLSGR